MASSFIEPMKALKVRDLPEGNWVREVRFDEYRALAVKDGNEVHTRSGHMITRSVSLSS